jgi:hypothetical protein
LLLKSFSWFEQVLGFEVYVPERLVDQAVVRLVVSDGKDGVSLDGVQPQLQIVESYFRKKKKCKKKTHNSFDVSLHRHIDASSNC